MERTTDSQGIAPSGTQPPPKPEGSGWEWFDYPLYMWSNLAIYAVVTYAWTDGGWVQVGSSDYYSQPIGSNPGQISGINPGGPGAGSIISGGTVDQGTQPTQAQIDAGTAANAAAKKPFPFLLVAGLAFVAWAFIGGRK